MTRLDGLLISIALSLACLALVYRGYEYWVLDQRADQVIENIENVAKAVHHYHEQTGRWFPVEQEDRPAQIYPDPFHHSIMSTTYQGLDERWLWLENNFGMVLQLVRFEIDSETRVTQHVFDESMKDGEPYLRLLLDYGKRSKTDTRVLMALQDRLPAGALSELDDHYYVLDIRNLRVE